MADLLQQLIETHRDPGQAEWVLPAYDGWCNTNLMNSVLAHFGAEHGAPLAFHGEFSAALAGVRKLLFILFDGMGWLNIERAHGRRPLVRRLLTAGTRWPLTTIFPSTTSASISSLVTGVPPALHGVIGYLMYFPEYRHVFNMLSFTTPDVQHLELTKFGFTPETYLGHPTIFHLLQQRGLLTSSFTYQQYVDSGLSRMVYHDIIPHPYYALGDMLAQAMGQLRAPLTQFIFLYWSTLDTLAHNYGAGSEAYADELAMLLSTVDQQVLPRLDHETALIIGADHGHIDGNDNDSINLMDYQDITTLLRAAPAGEGRAMHLFLQAGQTAHAQQLLAQLKGVTVLTRDELIARRLLGDMPPRVGLAEHIGDLVLLPHDSRRILYEYQPRPHTTMIGRHGGLSADEMLVPLLLFRK